MRKSNLGHAGADMALHYLHAQAPIRQDVIAGFAESGYEQRMSLRHSRQRTRSEEIEFPGRALHSGDPGIKHQHIIRLD